MKRSVRTFGGIATIVVLINVTGCSMPSSDLPTDPVARIMAAKSASQSAETTVADFVPEELVESRDQIPHGSLLSCATGRMWSGNTALRLTVEQDPVELADTIAEKAARRGFSVERDTTPSGTPRVTVTDESGVNVLVGVWKGGTVVDIDSFSMCFSLPEDYVPDPSY